VARGAGSALDHSSPICRKHVLPSYERVAEATRDSTGLALIWPCRASMR